MQTVDLVVKFRAMYWTVCAMVPKHRPSPPGEYLAWGHQISPETELVVLGVCAPRPLPRARLPIGP